MREIELTRGQRAIVDDADFDWLNQWKWTADTDGYNWYAYRVVRKNSKNLKIRMHRLILGLGRGDRRQIDHINHNGLDNRRCNIRICSCQQNQQNQKNQINVTSKFKGVSKCKQRNKYKWRTCIVINGKQKTIGRFEMEEVAALAYDIAATREFGEFANCNFN